MFPLSRRTRLAMLACGSILFAWLLSWLPYRVPFPKVYSFSYIFGYNNRVAMIVTACWAVLVALLAPSLPFRAPPGKLLTAATLRKTLAVSGLVNLILYLLTRKLGGVEESIYLIDRAKLLFEGHTPYREFEFAYGVVFLYGPVVFARLLHISVGDGYGLFWMSLTLLGIVLLWQTLRWVDLAPGAQRSVFLLFWAFTLVNLLTFGVSYTAFRYVLPCFFALVLYRQLGAPEQGRSRALFLLAPFFAMVLAVSPEIALSFAVGMSGFLLAFGYLRRRKMLLTYLGSALLIVALMFGSARLGMLSTMMAFSQGANNYPIVPGPHFLLMFLFLGLAACYVGQKIRQRQPDALTVLIAASGCGLAAALGQCDPLHVLFNLFGVMLAGSVLLAGLPKLRRPVWAATWFVFVGLRLYGLMVERGMEFQKAALPAVLTLTPARYATQLNAWLLARMTHTLGPAVAQTKFTNLRARLAQSSMDVPAIFHLSENTIFFAPFGFTPGGFGSYHTPSIAESFFFENENLVTVQRVQAKVAELRTHPERPLLLLPGRDHACILAIREVKPTVGPPFYFPYTGKPVHVNDVAEPICTEIRQNYHLARPASPETFGYQMWLPN